MEVYLTVFEFVSVFKGEKIVRVEKFLLLVHAFLDLDVCKGVAHCEVSAFVFAYSDDISHVVFQFKFNVVD